MPQDKSNSDSARQPMLGPFRVGQCIGRGGMGKVFEGVHTTTGMPVAIKVMAGGGDIQSKWNFHREVQAQAGLAHPGVVYLFDYGRVDEQAAQASLGQLGLGSPYVSMELADGQTLRDHMPLLNWRAVCEVLLRVLDALAYSHARGVVHRDLKPENLLIFGGVHGERRVKVADFGLAHAFEQARERSEQNLASISGTPAYMAPEQFRGLWRTYGPWTDLYALGCVAWELVCGRPPYLEKTFAAYAVEHCHQDIPPLEPIIAIPRGVEEWIRTAMTVDSRVRFQRAADAAFALPRWQGPDDTDPGGRGEFGQISRGLSANLVETIQLSTLCGPANTLIWSRDGADVDKPAEPLFNQLETAPHRPGLPQSWKPAGKEQLPAQLLGTGLGLFGFRDIPFADRDEVRDRIWNALGEVVDGGGLQVLFIAGESGVGKSRLAGWMATRAHEVGGAEILRVLHTRGGRGPAEGFSGLIQRLFHSWKLSRSELYEELLIHLPPLDQSDSFREVDSRALTELVHPTEDDADPADGPRYQFSSARQVQALMSRLMMRFSRHRAPVLWLDDLQFSVQGIGLIEYLLELPRDERPHGLILATIRTDVLLENTELARRIDSLAENEHCHRIDLDPIAASDHRALIDLMLPLSTELAEVLAERTEGNPLFAHQLLSHWISMGLIEVSRQGFDLATDKSPPLPHDIHHLWMERLDRLLARYAGEEALWAEEAVGLAAALGREVDGQEWIALCAQAAIPLPPGLDDALIERGLAVHTDDGWAFAHGLLVDSLEHRSRYQNRWRKNHRFCAQMLETLYRDQLGQTAQRRAEHWIEAGELERALEPLLTAGKRWFEFGELTQLERCVRLHRDLLERLGPDRFKSQLLENDLLGMELFFYEGRVEEGIARLEILLQECQEIDEPLLMLRVHEKLAAFFVWREEFDRAQAELQEALDLAVSAGDEYWQGKVTQRQGYVFFYRDRWDEAYEYFRRAGEHFRTCSSTYDELVSDVYRGWVQLSQENYQKGRQTLETVLAEASRRGYRAIESHCLNGLGDIARFTSDLERARHYYQSGRRLDLEIGDAHAETTSLINLAQIELAMEEFEKGSQLLEQARARADEFSEDRYVELFDCAELLLECGRGHWTDADAILGKYAGGWPDECQLYKDLPWLLELAAPYAEEAGKSEFARCLWHLTADLWQKLGNEEAATRARRRMTST